MKTILAFAILLWTGLILAPSALADSARDVKGVSEFIGSFDRKVEQKGTTSGAEQRMAMNATSKYAAGQLHLHTFPPLLSRDRQEASVVLAQAERDDAFSGEDVPPTISDPLEPLNRVFFHFNDKLYFWILKPAARGYKAVTPEKVRVGIRNFFYNLGFPVRFVNCLLQAKGDAAANELVRFFTNSTVGLFGLLDVATHKLELKKNDEDLGQTLGVYGLGPSFYINWPVLGPSSLRDTLGGIGDAFLDPVNGIDRSKYRASVQAYKAVNETSLSIGVYEDLKKAAIDPYVALRDAFFQRRQSMIKE